jgi:hypothetical protein
MHHHVSSSTAHKLRVGTLQRLRPGSRLLLAETVPVAQQNVVSRQRFFGQLLRVGDNIDLEVPGVLQDPLQLRRGSRPVVIVGSREEDHLRLGGRGRGILRPDLSERHQRGQCC